MVTPEEIQSIQLFATLGREACDRIARAAADIALMPGDYVAREGDERALCAVLEGHVDVLKVVDGIETRVGERYPGQLFGEIPITLGTAFPVDFRATERSRVMRLEASDYHAIAADHQQISAAVGKLAQGRISGLQNVAAEPPAPRATVVGDKLRGACGELRRFLDRNQLTLHMGRAGRRRRRGRNGAARYRPRGPPHPAGRGERQDGQRAAAAARRRASRAPDAGRARRVRHGDRRRRAGRSRGCGYGASEGLRTIVIEREAPGGQAGTSSRIENYLGFPSGVSGDELAGRALQQAKRLGAEILVTRTLERIDPATRRIYLDGGDVLRRGRSSSPAASPGGASRSTASTGSRARDLLRRRSRRRRGTHGQDVHIVGAGNSAGQAALHFANHARRVTILCRSASLSKSMSHYLIAQLDTRQEHPRADRQRGRAGAWREEAGGGGDPEPAAPKLEREDCHGLYVFIGADAETRWLPPEIALDERGYVLTGTDLRDAGRRWALDRDPLLLETSVPGIFACGDVRSSPVKRVAAAVGEGSMAIAFVHQYLREARAASWLARPSARTGARPSRRRSAAAARSSAPCP